MNTPHWEAMPRNRHYLMLGTLHTGIRVQRVTLRLSKAGNNVIRFEVLDGTKWAGQFRFLREAKDRALSLFRERTVQG